jgi:hypothetical protein
MVPVDEDRQLVSPLREAWGILIWGRIKRTGGVHIPCAIVVIQIDVWEAKVVDLLLGELAGSLAVL